MTTDLMGRARETLPGERHVDVDTLVTRLEAIQRFLRAADDHVAQKDLVAARTLVERAAARLSLSRDHTIVALAGATGSGKSSLFNAVARLSLSPVGVRRPTTGMAHACVWGPLEGANRLLDWIGVLPRHRFIRESALDGHDEAALHGLVLLDLPDFDSVERAHRMEVDRLLNLVDLVVWVVDPQKYADKVVHNTYLKQFRRHRDVTVVVLNQADLLPSGDVQRVLSDLRGLLETDGLSGVPILATAATIPAALTELRRQLERTVAQRQASLRRIWADADVVVADLLRLVGPAVAEDAVDRTAVRILADSLAASAGVPAVVDATERAYQRRASLSIGWPLLRWLRRLRPDPLHRLHLGDGLDGPSPASNPLRPGTAGGYAVPVAATSLPAPDAAQRSGVGLAVRGVAERATVSLPEPWPAAVVAAARSRVDELPDALDRAIARTDLGMGRPPLWWRAVGMIQWLSTAATILGLVWFVFGYAVRALGLPTLEEPRVGAVPLPSLLLLGGLVLGAVLAAAANPVVRWSASHARRRAEGRLRGAITDVARQYVISPVREVLHAYAEAREALMVARSEH